MSWFYYLETVEGQTRLIRVRAKRKPSFGSAATWHPVQELIDGRWQMASYPEVTWGVLIKLGYIGSEAP